MFIDLVFCYERNGDSGGMSENAIQCSESNLESRLSTEFSKTMKCPFYVKKPLGADILVATLKTAISESATVGHISPELRTLCVNAPSVKQRPMKRRY